MAAAASDRMGERLYRNPNVCPCIQKSDEPGLQCREIIKPSITELTKEVRTNILCTVQGCGKILPNTPALNMHLVKSHRVKDGLINPTVRKNMKGSQKLYCCPIEGCPRGPNRPFSQFSLVKQHFMKMHAERKHRCTKCSNCYSTEWDLRRHAEDCGKTYQCTCGCPYASRAALLSHTYRTGHEVPTEHRYPPVKKRKMEELLNVCSNTKSSEQVCPLDKEVASPEGVCHFDSGNQNLSSTKGIPKLLLPKPKVALLNVPVMQFAHLPVLLSPADNTPVRSVVLAVNSQASLMSTVHLLPQSTGTVMPSLNTKSWNSRDGMSLSRLDLDPVSTGVQVNLENVFSGPLLDHSQKGKSTSTNIQTDISYLSKSLSSVTPCIFGESSISSCSQTDISVSAQVQLPVSVETQTFPPQSKITSSIGAQTDTFTETYLPTYTVSRETQTSAPQSVSDDRGQMDPGIKCADLFDNESLSVSTQTILKERPFRPVGESLDSSSSSLYDDKPEGVMSFSSQTELLHQNSMADNQTQTMALFNDLENILSHTMVSSSFVTHGSLSDSTVGCETGLTAVQDHNTSIDFDFEEFLNAAHTQTQTEECDLGTLTHETPLESLDIETQTDFLFLDHPTHSDGNPRPTSNDLGLETFDTQTQTDLNFLLDSSAPIPLGSFLKQSSFSVSTESSDTETQTDVQAASLPSTQDNQIKLSSTETQTVSSSFESLGNLFLTSNETQTVMDDFLMADLAWNMESHFSSVETQTCEELCSLFHQSEKPNS